MSNPAISVVGAATALGLTDVFSGNPRTGEVIYLISLETVDTERFHGQETNPVTYLAAEEGGNPGRLAVFRPDGSLAYEVNARLLNADFGIGPVAWSTDGSEFWAEMEFGPSPVAFLRLTAGSWALRIYDVAGRALALDHSLHTDTGLAAFSNYLAMFDADTRTLEYNHPEEEGRVFVTQE
ncbi:MAG TPA: hypothetical protein VJK02_15450 [Anaerolineales bacterium]|nr:hypothetical protein [Anaerolineales bacterium]